MYLNSEPCIIIIIIVNNTHTYMNLEVTKLNIWLQVNKLTLNTTKTHYMVFDRGKKQSGNNFLTLNNKSIGRMIANVMIIGDIIDEHAIKLVKSYVIC